MKKDFKSIAFLAVFTMIVGCAFYCIGFEDDNKEVNAADKKGELLELLKSISEEVRAALMAEASK